MKKSIKYFTAATTIAAMLTGACSAITVQAANPYMPLWEHVADAEPHVFTDPETGEERVYVYGSHDITRTNYCGPNYVVWSAPVDDLTDWTYHGVCYEVEDDGLLFAPDVCQGPDGKFYMYTMGPATGFKSDVLVADSPTGPFQLLQHDIGVGFDPAVLVDDDEKVYVYSSGDNGSQVMVMDSDMQTVLEQHDMVNDEDGGPVQNFYEGSSIRKVADDMYVFVYCSHRENDPEYVAQTLHGQAHDYRGLLEYSYSDNPIGPWTYGGILIDNGGEMIQDGTEGYYEGSGDYYYGTRRTYYDGNIHGGMEEINGQWYIFYHKQTNNSEYSRQACAEPLDLKIEDGKLVIEQAEMTSQGVETDGLDPLKTQPAGLACYLTNGAYITSGYEENPDYNPIVNLRNGAVAGIKYLNFGDASEYTLNLSVMPKGQAGKIAVKLDDPASDPVAMVEVSGDASEEFQQLTTNVGTIEGTHALFFVFYAEGEGEICEFNDFTFTK